MERGKRGEGRERLRGREDSGGGGRAKAGSSSQKGTYLPVREANGGGKGREDRKRRVKSVGD
jgi:hypothetical protein